MRMVLVLVDLTVLLSSMPRHSALADADVALGGDRSGLAAEVPIQRERNLSLVIMLVCIANRGGISRIAAGFAAIVGEARQEKIRTGIIHHPAIRKAPDMTPRRTCISISPSVQEYNRNVQWGVRRARGHVWGPSRGRPPPSWRHCRSGAEERGGWTDGQKPGGKP